RHSQNVEPLAVARRVEVVDGLAFNLPAALAVPKRRNRRNRTQQYWEPLHLLENLHANQVAADPALHEGVRSVPLLLRDPPIELFENGAQFRFASLRHRTEQHPAQHTEELPPELACLVQTFWAKCFYFESGIAQELRGLAHRNTRFLSYRSATVVFKICNPRERVASRCFPWRGPLWPPHGDRRS